jgi:hypothetical protein
MHHHEFLCRSCRSFSKIPIPIEPQRRQSCLSRRYGSEEVEQRLVLPVATKQSAGTKREAHRPSHSRT